MEGFAADSELPKTFGMFQRQLINTGILVRKRHFQFESHDGFASAEPGKVRWSDLLAHAVDSAPDLLKDIKGAQDGAIFPHRCGRPEVLLPARQVRAQDFQDAGNCRCNTA